MTIQLTSSEIKISIVFSALLLGMGFILIEVEVLTPILLLVYFVLFWGLFLPLSIEALEYVNRTTHFIVGSLSWLGLGHMVARALAGGRYGLLGDTLTLTYMVYVIIPYIIVVLLGLMMVGVIKSNMIE